LEQVADFVSIGIEQGFNVSVTQNPLVSGVCDSGVKLYFAIERRSLKLKRHIDWCRRLHLCRQSILIEPVCSFLNSFTRFLGGLEYFFKACFFCLESCYSLRQPCCFSRPIIVVLCQLLGKLTGKQLFLIQRQVSILQTLRYEDLIL